LQFLIFVFFRVAQILLRKAKIKLRF